MRRSLVAVLSVAIPFAALAWWIVGSAGAGAALPLPVDTTLPPLTVPAGDTTVTTITSTLPTTVSSVVTSTTTTLPSAGAGTGLTDSVVDCARYATQAVAQAALAADPSLAAVLDADGDGVACEVLAPALPLLPTTTTTVATAGASGAGTPLSGGLGGASTAPAAGSSGVVGGSGGALGTAPAAGSGGIDGAGGLARPAAGAGRVATPGKSGRPGVASLNGAVPSAAVVGAGGGGTRRSSHVPVQVAAGVLLFGVTIALAREWAATGVAAA